MTLPITLSLIAVSFVLALLVGFRGSLTRSREGKILAFVALLILPVLSVWGGFDAQLDRAESTQFCLTCHVMMDFGQSLHYDDPSYIPAQHYENNWVPRDHACYTCHTHYAMFGGLQAKMEGLRHIYVQYLGTVPKPTDIKLYTPFPNQTCLHCHLGTRRYQSEEAHQKTPGMPAQMNSGQLSCVSSGCHEFVHDVADLQGAKFWSASK